MNRIDPGISGATATLLLAAALAPYGQATEIPRTYLQLEAGRVQFDLPARGINRVDGGARLRGVSLGYDVNASLGLQLGYRDLGEPAARTDCPLAACLTVPLPLQGGSRVDAIQARLLKRWPLGAHGTSLEAMLGASHWNVHFKDAASVYDRSGTSLIYGAGVYREVWPSWTIGLQAERLTRGATQYAVQVRWRAGLARTAAR